MLTLDSNVGEITHTPSGIRFASLPYQYAVTGQMGGVAFQEPGLADRAVETEGQTTVVTGGQATWSADSVVIRMSLPAMSPAVITLGIR